MENMIFFGNQAESAQISRYFSSVTQKIQGTLHQSAVVGIIAPTSAMLIGAWRACVAAGYVPIILQFPTEKLSRVYWQKELERAIGSAQIELLLCADQRCVPDVDFSEAKVKAILLNELTLPDGAIAEQAFHFPDDSKFLQMSSGTTGFRKAIEFRFSDVKRHVEQYNAVLNIQETDCIVSWLPLYHDMGFIATFLMPQILGCKVVLMDPIAWVRQPGILWDAIEQHQGTICYMPNFGFELMAMHPRPSSPGMRLWISCSEPTRMQTIARFVQATGTPLDAIANCWGMAENIFAVCQSQGISSREVNGVEVVSCGKPLPGVSIKSVDGQIWVRSEYSLQKYVGLAVELDSEGYYATGDLGEEFEGQWYLLGRQHDVLISAGRKTLLSDIDYAVGEIVKESAGRIASFAMYDDNIGTEILVVLIEHPQFWRKNQEGELVRQVISATGIETTRVHFVPPRFITKTSSGKINRKLSRENWVKRIDFANSRNNSFSGNRAADEIREQFPWLDFKVPVSAQVDSLGFVNLCQILSKCKFEGTLRRDDCLESLFVPKPANQGEREVIKIVSLCDRNPFMGFFFDAVNGYVSTHKKPVHFKHICVPPLPVLLSDMAFMDYFRCRDENEEPYATIDSVVADLKSASVILIDDSVTLFWPHSENDMHYLQLSHDFIPDPDARLLGMRWAGYSQNYHLSKNTVVSGRKMAQSEVNNWIKDLSDYTGLPVVRIAYGADHPEVTADWEVQCGGDLRAITAHWKRDGVDLQQVGQQLVSGIVAALEKSPKRMSSVGFFVNYNDQPHWCSWLINPDIVDFVVEHFSDIVVLGKPSSVAYLFDRAAAMGRRIRIRHDLTVPDDCDCVVQTGSWGKPETNKPLFQIMNAGWPDGAAINLPAELQAICPPNRRPKTMEKGKESGC